MGVVDLVRSGLRRSVTVYSVHNRRLKAARIDRWMRDRALTSIIMVGAASQDGSARNLGIVEDAIMGGRNVVAGINLEPHLVPYPFVVGSALEMPFADDCVDFALANAVIEHVGDEAAQRKFVAEHVRVARNWVITTPNRRFPVEAHTATVFRHWRRSWRESRPEFSNLLSLREFKRMLPPGTEVTGHFWSPTFTAFYSR